METKNKKDDTLISDIGNKLNQNSMRVFIVMLILIVISISIALFKGLTREKKEFKIESISNQTTQDFYNDMQQIGNTYSNYMYMKNLSDEMDSLLEKEELSAMDSLRLVELYNLINRTK